MSNFYTLQLELSKKFTVHFGLVASHAQSQDSLVLTELLALIASSTHIQDHPSLVTVYCHLSLLSTGKSYFRHLFSQQAMSKIVEPIERIVACVAMLVKSIPAADKLASTNGGAVCTSWLSARKTSDSNTLYS